MVMGIVSSASNGGSGIGIWLFFCVPLVGFPICMIHEGENLIDMVDFSSRNIQTKRLVIEGIVIGFTIILTLVLLWLAYDRVELVHCWVDGWFSGT